jgi:hypothetical protein
LLFFIFLIYLVVLTFLSLTNSFSPKVKRIAFITSFAVIAFLGIYNIFFFPALLQLFSAFSLINISILVISIIQLASIFFQQKLFSEKPKIISSKVKRKVLLVIIFGIIVTAFIFVMALKEKPFPGYSKVKKGNPVIFVMPGNLRYMMLVGNMDYNSFTYWVGKRTLMGPEFRLTIVQRENLDMEYLQEILDKEVFEKNGVEYAYIPSNDPKSGPTLEFIFENKHVRISALSQDITKQFLLDLASTAYQLN